MGQGITRTRRRLGLIAAGALLLLLLGAAPAAAQAPWWRITTGSAPTNLPPGGEGEVLVTVVNIGDASANVGHPLTVTDKLPEGLEATKAFGIAAPGEGAAVRPGNGGKVECVQPAGPCTLQGKNPVRPYEAIEIFIKVKVNQPSGTKLINEVTVEGEGTPTASDKSTLTVDSTPTPFGIERFQLAPENEGGSPVTQAGSHPFQLTTTISMNDTLIPAGPKQEKFGVVRSPIALTRDVKVIAPPGLIGNLTAIPQCTEAQFTEIHQFVNKCPPESAVGVVAATVYEPFLYFESPGVATLSVPVFNLTPAPGEPARFGFEVDNILVFVDTSVRTGGDYAVVASVNNISQVASLLSSQVTLWGVPGDKRHDASRGWTCVAGSDFPGQPPCTPLGQTQPPPFLTMPTSCTQPLVTTLLTDSWPEPGAFKEAQSETPPLEGCNRLPFEPSIEVQPDQQAASTPTGLNVKVKVPQSTTLAADGLAEAAIKETTVALPVGVQASPAAASGLLACTGEQVGLQGGFPETVESLTENNHFTADAVRCPDGAKIGRVRIKTPLLARELFGSVYLASQNTNPFASPLVLYLIAEDKPSAVRVKLAGEVQINQETGQLVSTFKNTPPLPFEELDLELFGGPRASQSTPATCGSYTATSSFTPWSGTAPTTPSSSFAITSGPNGSPCPSGPLPFGPTFQAGTTNNQAGGFTPFTLTINRPDGNQALKSISMTLPPGIAGMISSVTPCPEPQAAQGTCGPESLIGHSTASSGLGSQPFTLPGRVYLTGPYKGAPFGIDAVTPAEAGPFNLGNVIVRSTINVDKRTGAVSITSDPLPQMLKGVPTQLKQLNVTVDRSNFQFNPTNCSPMAITGTLTGYEGASTPVSAPYQASGCSSLGFAPIFTASTSAHTSKANGASLKVKIVYPPGSYANIAKTVTDLPIALPSRLTTIQKACPDHVFEANPASCPEGSVVGTATAHTPVLKNPLTGPAYLVSHGNKSFPDVVFLVQGEGITVELDGQTDIKKGITKNTFDAVPDAPISSFEVALPEGPHSALGATTNLCANGKTITTRKKVTVRRNGRSRRITRTVKRFVAQPLLMPTTLTGQNGAVLKQQTKIAVVGCKATKASKSSVKRKAHSGRKK